MAHSLLKNMSGSRDGVEGIYASSDLFSLPGTSLNTDLGLTLLPGSQTQKENEDSGDSVTSFGLVGSVGRDEQRRTTAELDSDAQNVCRSGSSESQAPFYLTRADTRTKSRDLTNVPNLEFRNGIQTQYNDRSPRAEKRRKLERRHLHQSSDIAGSESSSIVNVSQHRKGLTGVADANYIQSNGGMLSNNSSSTFTSGGTSVLDPRNFGILQDDSPEDFVSCALQKRTRPTKSSNTDLQILSVGEELKLHDIGSSNSSAVSKLPVEIWLSKDSQLTIHGHHHPAHTATKASLQQRSESLRSTSNATESHRRPVLDFFNKATRSWTSHFPKTSKPFRARSDAVAPASSPAAAVSLMPVAGHHNTPSADNASTTIRIYQNQTALSQSRALAPLSQTSPPAREFGSPSNRYSAHYLLNTTIAGYQQHPPHKRTNSLPNLPLRHRMSTMDPAQCYEPSALPTPPSEKQPFPYQRLASNSLSSPAVGANMWNNAHKGVFDGLNPFTTSSTPLRAANDPHNHSQNNFCPTNTMTYHSESAQHQHLPLDGGFAGSTSQTMFPGGSTTLAFQQSNGHMIQQKKYYGHAEIQDLLNGWHQLWEARSRRRDAIYQSQLSQEKSQSQNLLHQNARLGFESKILKLNLGQLQQEQEVLKSRIPHDNGDMYQHIQSMYNTLAYRDQEVAFLQQENGRLHAANYDLISQMEKLAAQPRPNSAIAKNILQTLSRPNAVTVPTPTPSQVSLPHEHSTDTALPHQNYVQSRYPSNQLERQTTTSTTGQVNPEAYSTGPIPTSLVESTSVADHSSLAAQADLNLEGNVVGIERRPMVSDPKIMIDLTNDSHPSSLSEPVAALPLQTNLPFAHEQSETEQTPADLQAQTAIRTAFNRKELEWMDGLHPGRAIHTPGVTFGLPSSKQALAAQANQGPNNASKINSKKTKEVMDALASHDDAQNEQLCNDQHLKKGAKKAASQKKYLGNKRKEPGKVSKQTLVAPSGPSQNEKQGRKSAKVRKRQQAASQPLAKDHHPVAQYTLDGRPLEEHIEHPSLNLTNPKEQQPGAAGVPLVDDNDDMEVMHFPEYTLNEDQDDEMTPAQFQAMLTAEVENNTDPEEGAAELEAMLIADAEADADSDDDGAAAFQAMMEAEARALEAAENGIEDPSATVTKPNTDGSAYHEDSESEVSEEE